MHKLERKAKKIWGRTHGKEKESKVNSWVVFPYNKRAEILKERLGGLHFIMKPGNKIGDILREGRKSDLNAGLEDTTVYMIPCKSCQRAYYGETHRDLEVRVREHERDMRYGRETNALVTHRLETDHVPNWEGVQKLYGGAGKRKRRVIVAAYISERPNVNNNCGFYKLASLVSLHL